MSVTYNLLEIDYNMSLTIDNLYQPVIRCQHLGTYCSKVLTNGHRNQVDYQDHII